MPWVVAEETMINENEETIYSSSGELWKVAMNGVLNKYFQYAKVKCARWFSQRISIMGKEKKLNLKLSTLLAMA